MSKRQLSAYEKNHLHSHGIDFESIDSYGEMPVEYITNTVKFLGRVYRVTQDTLIPRIETEELVEHIAQEFLSMPFKKLTQIKAADVGTGSGVIGLSLLDYSERSKISLDMTLTDISGRALTVARENYQRLFPKNLRYGSIRFHEGDLLSGISKSEQYAFIVANLPYIPTNRISSLQTSVKDFEPILALDGGKWGFDLVQRLTHDARSFLMPGGKLFLEVDDTHGSELFLRNVPEYQWQFLSDQFQKQRFAVGTLKESYKI